jgi:exopolysaccharide biosynthesis polyprenyl glycosylphosphotransferase
MAVSPALRQTNTDGASMTALSQSTPRPQFAAPIATKSAAHPLRQATQATAQGYRWKRSYRVRVLLIDTIAVVTAVVLASIGRFGLPDDKHPPVGLTWANSPWASLAIYSVALVVIWLTALGMQHSRDLTLVGVGAEEYRLVLTATLWVFGIVAAAGLVAREQVARGYLLIAFPVGLIGLLIGRHLLRRHLTKKRARGKFMNHVVVLGTRDAVESLSRSFERSKGAGYKVIGACVLDSDATTCDALKTAAGEIPVLGDENSVEEALRLSGADALAVAAAERLGHERVRQLLWCLDPLGIDMVVVPGMMDIAGPRLKVRPLDNLPLFHIARPRHESSSSRNGKRLFDVAFASVALLLAIPIFLVAAVAIKIGDGGPVFFRQWRRGLHGRPFRILKFRTMSTMPDAIGDSECAALADPSEGIFFGKSASESRVTRVGRFLRKTSVDELPQLLNVLAGSMSIVGPRPLQLGEAASVEHFIERRELVKPGITGLWQVSGRSDISVEERIRLDYSYVDNWSCVHDMAIVLQTVRTVLKRQGAY